MRYCGVYKLREPLSILIKYKTIDTPKIEFFFSKCFQFSEFCVYKRKHFYGLTYFVY